jgi:hypothetical protein
MSPNFAAAREFIHRNGRLLDRRLFMAVFEGGATSDVIRVLRGYQNSDGGFGHALEPDTRCPHSLPIYVETALQVLVMVGDSDAAMVKEACDYLGRVAVQVDAGGAVPLAFDVIESYPRAAHWTDWTYAPALNPTAGIVGLLYSLNVEHPWVDEAARYCWNQLDRDGLSGDAHTVSEVLRFLAHTPDQDRAKLIAASAPEALSDTPFFRLDPQSPGYGLSPLHIAPSPESRWHSLFTSEQIAGHLDQLTRDQQDDGGWPIRWEPPSDAALLEWRASETIRALTVLRAYDQLSLGAS